MKKDITRWKIIDDMINSHKSLYRDELSQEGAIQLLFTSQQENDYQFTLDEDEKFRRQTFRWAKNPKECKFLWDNNEFEESSYSGSEEIDDEQEFFDSIMEHNLQKEIVREKHEKVANDSDPTYDPKLVKHQSSISNQEFDNLFDQYHESVEKKISNAEQLPSTSMNSPENVMGDDEFFSCMSRQSESTRMSRKIVYQK